MITMDMLGKVRRMRLRDKLSISEIAKRTGLARNTVRGWLSAPGDVIPKYERRSDTCKITDYEVSLIMALKADSLRHKDSLSLLLRNGAGGAEFNRRHTSGSCRATAQVTGKRPQCLSSNPRRNSSTSRQSCCRSAASDSFSC